MHRDEKQNSRVYSSLTPIFEIVRDSSMYGISRIISAALGFISIPIFARIMAPDVFGVYSLALLTVTIAYQFVNEWSRSSILRFDAKYRNTDEYDSYISNVFVPPVGLGLVIGGIIIAIGLTTHIFIAFEKYLFVGVGVLNLSIIYTLLITLLRVRQEAKRFAVLQVLNRIGTLFLGVSLILVFKMEGEGLFYGWLITSVFLIVLCGKWSGIYGNLSFKFLHIHELKRYLNYGIPLTFFALFAFMMKHIDRYMIKYFRDMTEVGLYSFACLLPERTINMLIGTVALGAFPVIVKEWENSGRETTTQLTSQLARYYFLLAVPLVVLMFLFPKSIMSVMGTAKYEVAYAAIPLVTLAAFFNGAAWFSTIAFNLSTKTSLLLIVTVCSLLINVGLNFLMIPKWGYLGAACSTVITSLVYFICTYLFSRKWLPWRLSMNNLRNILLASAALIFTALLRIPIIESSDLLGVAIHLFLAFASYVGVLILTKEVSTKRLKNMLNIS